MTINFKRGLNRLFIVLSLAFYARAGWSLYSDWDIRAASHKSSLALCLDNSVPPVTPAWRCREMWPEPKLTSDDYIIGGITLAFPPALYVLLFLSWRIITWVGRGFRNDKAVSA